MIAAVSRAVPAALAPFDEVYRDNVDALFRFCLSQLGDQDTAEDVAGDVFAAAYAAYERVRPDPGGVRTWLFRIARNAVIDQYRREGRRRALLTRIGRSREFPETVEETAEMRSDLRSVLAAVDDLRGRDRQLVGLRIAGGLSYAEIGAVLGMREGTAKVAANRALAHVRATLRAKA